MHKTPLLKKVIFDAGPLLIALTINYSFVKELKQKENLIQKVYDKFNKLNFSVYNLKLFFDNIQFYYTTPHVIGEVIGLVKSRLKLEENENEFWYISLEYLKTKNISEQLISIMELTNDLTINPLIPIIGFVDSELIKYSIQSNLPILSIDKQTLKFEAKKKTADVLILEDDIYAYIDI